MIVKFVNYPRQYQAIKKEIDAAIQKCLDSGDFILREEVSDFEQSLAKYVGTKYAVGLNSGTDALVLALETLGIGAGDEVITTGYTFWATVEAIMHRLAIPVLVDIGEDLQIDVSQIEEKITLKTKAIIPVHIGGMICQMDKLKELALKHNLFIIEDAAQGLGIDYKGKKTGSLGDIGCFSFYPAKILGAYGDAGAITTDNWRWYERIKLLREHGGKRAPQCVGYNSRLDNMQAAILNVKFKYLDGAIKKRREIAKMYDKGLGKIAKIRLPVSQTYQEYNLICENNVKLHQYLKDGGIETILGAYHFPIEQPMGARSANHSVLRLPISPELTADEIDYVIKTINEFYA